MAYNATLDQIFPALVSALTTELTARGLVAAYASIQTSVTDNYPVIMTSYGTEGSYFNWDTISRGTIGGPSVPGTDERTHNGIIYLLLGGRGSDLASLETEARKWVDPVVNALRAHQQLGGIVQKIEIVKCTPDVLALQDGPHYGLWFHFRALTRPQVTIAQ